MTNATEAQACPSPSRLRGLRASPALGVLASISVAMAAAGCEDRPHQAYRIGSAVYAIPPSHVSSAREAPDTFIRIDPPEASYELVYDARTAGQIDDRGNPVVFSITDDAGATAQRVQVDNVLVLCRLASHPRNGCGTSVPINGALWSVLIPPSRVNEAPLLVDQARAYLTSHRVS